MKLFLCIAFLLLNFINSEYINSKIVVNGIEYSGIAEMKRGSGDEQKFLMIPAKIGQSPDYDLAFKCSSTKECKSYGKKKKCELLEDGVVLVEDFLPKTERHKKLTKEQGCKDFLFELDDHCKLGEMGKKLAAGKRLRKRRHLKF